MALFKVGFISYTLRREVDINVILPTCTIPESMGIDGQPPTHKHTAPFPVLYLLHGMGNNYSVWGRYTNVEVYAEERNICVVMISGENKGYRNIESGDRHYDFLAKELPEFMAANFPISTRPEDTYIAGLSMGSMGTILHALSMPERFRAAGAFSGPAMKMIPMDADMSREERMKKQAELLNVANPEDAVNPEIVEYVKAAKAAGKKFPDFYVSTGTQDGPERAKMFADYLAANGVNVTTNFEKEYGHEWRCWNENIEEFLDWIPRTDAYKGSKRKI